MKKMILVGGLGVLLGGALCTVACTTTNASSSNDGGAAADAGSPMGLALNGDAGSPGINCLQILQCASDCPESPGTTCADACLAKGSPEGKTQASAFGDCFNSAMCTDVDCVHASCQTQLDTCVNASKPQAPGNPAGLDGAPAQGSVPPELVGTWTRVNYGATDRIVLKADGTGSNFNGISSTSSGCVTTNSSTQEGVTVVANNFITIYATTVTNDEKICSAPTQKTSGTPVVVQIGFTLQDPTTLVIATTDCVNKYPNDPTNQAFYCREELKKE